MTISRLKLTNFTVFEKATFEFCPGINVLIGENGTGKSHVLKVMYAGLRSWDSERRGEDDADIERKLDRVFRPDEFRSLVHRRRPEGFELEIVDHRDHSTFLHLVPEAKSWTSTCRAGLKRQPCIFVPPREVLAMYRGFIAAYEGRELDFDETYYDLCKGLSAAPLRGARASAVQAMLAPLERILGGKVALEGDRFFIKRADGATEAHLVAEGLRKIASLAYLVANGTLTPNSVLFWDEPEASLNPSLVVKVVEFLQALVASGVQVFLASHDFLLVHRLSQAVEYKVGPAVPVRFFSLYREEPGAPVDVEQGDTLADIEHNAILDEFARYYDREQLLSAQAMGSEDSSEVPAASRATAGVTRGAAKKQTKSGRTGAASKKAAKTPSKRGAAKQQTKSGRAGAAAKKAAKAPSKRAAAKKVARG